MNFEGSQNNLKELWKLALTNLIFCFMAQLEACMNTSSNSIKQILIVDTQNNENMLGQKDMNNSKVDSQMR